MFTDGAWAGRDAFLIGGGPSLSNFDWKLLRGRLTIGINAMYREWDPTILFTEDGPQLERWFTDPAWHELTALRVYHCLNDKEKYHDIAADKKIWRVCDHKGEPFVWPASFKDGLAWTSAPGNSAIAAASLADILRVKRLFLVGIDARAGSKGQTNYHERHPVHQRAGPSHFAAYARQWAEFVAPRIKAETFNLIDAAFPSALGCFPKLDRARFFDENSITKTRMELRKALDMRYVR